MCQKRRTVARTYRKPSYETADTSFLVFPLIACVTGRFLYNDVVDPKTIDLARPSRAEFLREYIIFILKSVDLQDHAGEAEEAIRRFLGQENTRHLLHELKAWLRSPCKSLEEWDRTVQYRVDSFS